MDEKGANTFPFHNLPPKLKNLKRSFLFFSPFPYWIKEKPVVTLAIRFAIKRKTKSVLPTYYRTGDYVGETQKWGYL